MEDLLYAIIRRAIRDARRGDEDARAWLDDLRASLAAGGRDSEARPPMDAQLAQRARRQPALDQLCASR